jgi:serine/threonine protein kinase
MRLADGFRAARRVMAEGRFSAPADSAMNGVRHGDAMEAEPATDGHLEPGTNLNGTYEIVQRLFEGGMADIYEARHVRLTGRYAVKVLRHSLTSQHASAFDRFRREAEVTSSLRHPNIVQVLDFNQTATGAAYFVMELLEGQNLRQHLEAHGAMPLPDVAAIVEQVASALAAAHTRGIVHRDLKPENIHMLPVAGRKEPFVKVLDFGISKVLAASTLTQEAMIVGTPHYMAPEQARGGSDDLDGRTDEFALGVIAHELLTGRRVFNAEAVFAILYQVMNDEPASLEPIAGAAVDQIIRKALAKNRDDRYPNVALFADALREAVFGPPRASMSAGAHSGRIGSSSVPVVVSPSSASGTMPPPGVVTPPIGTAPSAPPPRRSQRRRALAAGVVLLVAAAVVIVRLRPSGPLWAPPTEKAAGVAGELESVMRRLLAAEAGELAERAGRAGKVPNLANAVVGRVDDTTFQDLLANEIWWSDFRAFGCVVLVRDEVKVAWHLPALGISAADLGKTMQPEGTNRAPHSGLVSGTEGTMLAAVATVDGLPDGRVILVLPVDRAMVARLASRANIVLLLSDGTKMLATSVPENTLPEIERLVGKEDSHVLIDKQHDLLATAVLWTKGLWLWGVTGWTS